MLGLRLDPDAVRALHVPAHDREHDAAEEHQAGEIADEDVRLVRRAVQELQDSGIWWSISSTVVTPSRPRNPK